MSERRVFACVVCPYFYHREKTDRRKEDAVAWHDCSQTGRFGTVQSEQKNTEGAT